MKKGFITDNFTFKSRRYSQNFVKRGKRNHIKNKVLLVFLLVVNTQIKIILNNVHQ